MERGPHEVFVFERIRPVRLKLVSGHLFWSPSCFLWARQKSEEKKHLPMEFSSLGIFLAYRRRRCMVSGPYRLCFVSSCLFLLRFVFLGFISVSFSSSCLFS